MKAISSGNPFDGRSNGGNEGTPLASKSKSPEGVSGVPLAMEVSGPKDSKNKNVLLGISDHLTTTPLSNRDEQVKNSFCLCLGEDEECLEEGISDFDDDDDLLISHLQEVFREEEIRGDVRRERADGLEGVSKLFYVNKGVEVE